MKDGPELRQQSGATTSTQRERNPMSLPDGTHKLDDNVYAHITMSIDTPMVRAEVLSNGRINLYLGGIALAVTPLSAIKVIDSLTAAVTQHFAPDMDTAEAK